jgi:hypothetical protein
MIALIKCIGDPELAFVSSSVIASLVNALASDDLIDCSGVEPIPDSTPPHTFSRRNLQT